MNIIKPQWLEYMADIEFFSLKSKNLNRFFTTVPDCVCCRCEEKKHYQFSFIKISFNSFLFIHQEWIMVKFLAILNTFYCDFIEGIFSENIFFLEKILLNEKKISLMLCFFRCLNKKNVFFFCLSNINRFNPSVIMHQCVINQFFLFSNSAI